MFRKMTDSDKFYTNAVTLSMSTRSELTQMSLVVSAALVHVHCLLEAPRLLAPVANHCHFVDSSRPPEKTVVLGGLIVYVFQWESCLFFFT